MRFDSIEKINDLVAAFESRSLPKSEWTHLAHLTVGLHYCFGHPFGVAKNLMSDGIYWLNDAHGTPNTETSGYHETLTVFWLNEISSMIERNPGDDIVQLAVRLGDELNDTKLALKHYSRELLFSTEARRAFVPPDLDPEQGTDPFEVPELTTPTLSPTG